MINSLLRVAFYLIPIVILIIQIGSLPLVRLQQVTETLTFTPTTSPTLTVTSTPGTETGTLTTTATNTPTTTPIVTVTPTLTSQTTTPTATPVLTLPIFPTSTSIVIVTQASPTAQDFATPGGPTATLMPFPSITYIFPTPSDNSELLAIERQPDEPSLAKGFGDLLRSRVFVLAACSFLILVWIILGVWFVWVLRQTE